MDDVRKLDLEPAKPAKKEVVGMPYKGGLWDVKLNIETTMYHANDRKYEFHSEDREDIQKILKDLQLWVANIIKAEEYKNEIPEEFNADNLSI